MPINPAVPGPDVDLEERRRLEALAAYAVVEAFDEPEFNDLVALVGDLLNAPVATIGVLDESQEWFKARLGTDVRRIPRAESFARHLLAEPHEALAVEDMSADPRFAQSVFVTGHPHFRAYLAVPVVSVDGTVLGTLEALDVVPRTWTEREIRHLRTLAQVLEAHLELHRFVRTVATA